MYMGKKSAIEDKDYHTIISATALSIYHGRYMYRLPFVCSMHVMDYRHFFSFSFYKVSALSYVVLSFVSKGMDYSDLKENPLRYFIYCQE